MHLYNDLTSQSLTTLSHGWALCCCQCRGYHIACLSIGRYGEAALRLLELDRGRTKIHSYCPCYLELLTSVLAEMAFETQHTGPDTTLAAVLQSCTGKLKSLTALTNNLEPGFCSRSSRVRKWTAVKLVMKREKLTRFQEVLESLKSTLMLAQQNRHK